MIDKEFPFDHVSYEMIPNSLDLLPNLEYEHCSDENPRTNRRFSTVITTVNNSSIPINSNSISNSNNQNNNTHNSDNQVFKKNHNILSLSSSSVNWQFATNSKNQTTTPPNSEFRFSYFVNVVL